MAVDEDLLKKLRYARSDWAEEAAWHKFLLDAATGTGGFKGRFGATPISHLGWAAEAYASIRSAIDGDIPRPVDQRETYLDQFPREEADKFSRRIDVAHYTNFTGPIHELLVAYVNKAEFSHVGIPTKLTDWMNDVDGHGTSWEALQKDVIRPRAALLGWTPVLFDMPVSPAEPGVELSEERAQEANLVPQAIPLFPVNVLDWIEDDDKELVAVKIRTDHWVRPDLLSDAVKEERYALWYRDKVVHYTVTLKDGKPTDISDPDERSHTHGCVPLVSFRAKPTPDDPVRGLSLVGDLAVANRRYFNLESESDDHIRQQVFAILGVPVEDTSKPIGEIVGGSHSALKIPMQSNMPLHYVAPPATVAATLEKRIDVLRRDIYRMAGVKDDDAASGSATSGLAHAYRFDHTNKRLGSIATSYAGAEQKSLRLVGKMWLVDASEEITCTPPTDFSVEDLAADVANVAAALDINLGATASKELRRRLIRKLAPNLPPKVVEAIEAELEELVKQQEQDDALARETARASLLDPGEDDVPPPGDEEPEPNDEAA